MVEDAISFEGPNVACSEAERGREHRGEFVFILTVVGAYVSAFLVSDLQVATPRSAVVLGLGVVFVLLGVRGYELTWGIHPLAGPMAYFVVQSFLGGVIIYLSEAAGLMSLVVLPITSQAAGNLPRRWTLVVCAMALAALAVPVGLMAGWVSALGAAASLLVGIVFTVTFTDIALGEARARREVERLAAELREANRRLRAYAAQAEELATMRERNRLAREIHDTLGHHLTTVNVQLEAARAVLESDPERALQAVESAQALTKKGLAEVRGSVAALRASPTERKPLPEAIAALVDELQSSGIVAEFVVAGQPRELSPEVQLALYRTAQEGLTNVRRHARASWVQVELDYRDATRVRLTVEDNGVGATSAEGGFGLIGVRERVLLLDGEMRTETTPREGFRLDVEVPA
jgi:signal transduction histidine kinase